MIPLNKKGIGCNGYSACKVPNETGLGPLQCQPQHDALSGVVQRTPPKAIWFVDQYGVNSTG